MKHMKAHLEDLRDQAAECALRSGEAETREKRDLFEKMNAHLNWMADHVEAQMNAAAATGIFDKTQMPFPRRKD